jgi:hypothetical protein
MASASSKGEKLDRCLRYLMGELTSTVCYGDVDDTQQYFI